jgi:hypothetical protein
MKKGKEQALSPDFQGFVTKRQTVYCTRLPPQIPHASAPDLLRRPSHHAHDLRAGVHVERVVVQQQVRVLGFQPDLLGVGVRRDNNRVSTVRRGSTNSKCFGAQKMHVPSDTATSSTTNAKLT